MAKYRTEALVLGVHNWGEADKMVTLFTRDRGRVRAAAFGCRRPKSALAAGMQMFQHIEAELAEGQRLDTVRQCSILRHYKKLSGDLPVIAYGSFVAELVCELMPEHVPEPEVFDLLLEIFSAFEYRHPRVAALTAAYQLLEYSGMQLSYEHCIHCGKEITENAGFRLREGGAVCHDCAAAEDASYPEAVRQLIVTLRDFDWKEETRIQVKTEALLPAEQMLLEHLLAVLGHPLKSLAFIEQMGA